MSSISVPTCLTLVRLHGVHSLPHPHFPCTLVTAISPVRSKSRRCSFSRAPPAFAHNGAGITNSVPPRNGTYTVGDFMTRKEDLHVVKTTTTVDEALECLVEKRITGFPVIDDDWKLVGVVSDYDLLAIDSISGCNQNDANLFPNVNSSWKTFNEIQRLLSKNNGKVVGDLMTPTPLVVYENTNLEDAASILSHLIALSQISDERLLLETKYRRLPVVDGDGKLVGIITRGNVVKAALHIKRSGEKLT
ncbi:CBS domain-containing protein CBSX1, chloroplastic-like isoform X2 [Mangifera indica]|uniref:CBS domain-containing protein CBSX1, chloroplastic-like isoform X2 n=2 Tax=Mangifera indica TaxID=29780 RepID=UPI001CFA70A3|nr:CBS domain-containing protein CBSX1, chloroplastic-like isoform X2 [Mangifera indica]XP_044489295.1 CBS domain-containing protein CBSX1, chloroplastic-like isoform X2 [Mangifera indica]